MKRLPGNVKKKKAGQKYYSFIQRMRCSKGFPLPGGLPSTHSISTNLTGHDWNESLPHYREQKPSLTTLAVWLPGNVIAIDVVGDKQGGEEEGKGFLMLSCASPEPCQPRALPCSTSEALQNSRYIIVHQTRCTPSDVLQAHPAEKQETASPRCSIPAFFVKMQRVTLTADAPKHLGEDTETESSSK